jgi:hypothetical protein
MWVIADVTFDTDAEAREAQRLITEGMMPGVSVDLGNVTAEVEILAEDDEGWPTDWLETVTSAEIVGATQVAMPAFADARIEAVEGGFVAFLAPEGVKTSDRRIIEPGALTWRDPAPLMFNTSSDGHQGAELVARLENFRRGLVASCPVEWQTDPELPLLTKPVIEEGQIRGHGAGWGTCHTAFKNACVTAPSSSYSEWSGKIYRHPNGDIHAPLNLSLDEARDWYENHCEVVGEVGVGEDAHGIWVNGATTLEDGEVFLSGDWRQAGESMELVSFLVVDNPGFPVALVANEVQTALTSAGIVTSTDPTEARIAALERTVSDLQFEIAVRDLERSIG